MTRTSLPDSHPLQRKRFEALNARSSARKTRDALSSYLASANAKDFNFDDFGALLDKFSTLTAKVDNRLLDLSAELQELDGEIEKARQPEHTEVSVLFIADEDEEIELVLKYGTLAFFSQLFVHSSFDSCS
jgi:hypothetical protein